MKKILKRNIRRILLWHLILLQVFLSCAGQKKLPEDESRKVKAAASRIREIPDEAGGFGSLSFLTKVDIASPQDGVIKKLFFREGETLRQGEAAVLLGNPQIDLAVERAENNYSQAKAACDLARSRLLEGEFQAEAQILSLEKTETELALTKKKWEEENRKHQNQEALFEAGGINTEAIRTGRFNLEIELEQIVIMEQELEIRKIGCRDRDLVAAGLTIPQDEAERRNALVSLMTASLRAELGAANARLDAAEKELKSARIAREELLIKSPASGVIGARYFEEGERVKTEDKILTLMDTAALYAVFPVREKDALRIGKGMPARIQVDGAGESIGGNVDLVYPQADSLSFLVRVLLESSGSGSLKPGMFARVQVALGPPRQALVIPESSFITKKDSEGMVFVVNGSVVSERKLSLGQALGEEREIVSGLKAGELVVIRPESDLKEGVYVSLAE